MTESWVQLLITFVVGGGGAGTVIGGLNLWRQRKADSVNAAADRFQKDRDTLDKRIADSFTDFENRILELTGEARAAKIEMGQLWDVIFTYRRREVAWLDYRQSIALDGRTLPPLPAELQANIAVPTVAPHPPPTPPERP